MPTGMQNVVISDASVSNVPSSIFALPPTVEPNKFGVICSKVGIGWFSHFNSFHSTTFNLNEYTACHYHFLLTHQGI